MSIDEFWEAFRDHQVAVQINTIDQRSAVTELAQERGFYTGSQDYSIHQYPWVIYWWVPSRDGQEWFQAVSILGHYWNMKNSRTSWMVPAK